MRKILQNNKKKRSSDFSQGFEQMCNLMAISETSDPNETLKQLILQCFVILTDNGFESPKEIVESIETIYGLHLPTQEVEASFDELVKAEMIFSTDKKRYIINPEIRSNLQERMNEASKLEESVKQEWFEELRANPSISQKKAWIALRAYLCELLRRHGMQTVAFLDPNTQISERNSRNLSAMLDEAVIKSFDDSQKEDAKKIIVNFIAKAGSMANRTKYIIQLADGAFSYFTLAAAPEVAKRFRKQLSELTLFLDTNFLFGILDLQFNEQVEASNALIKAIKKHNLPFTVVYDEATKEELELSLKFCEKELKSCNWPQALSRAVLKSKSVTGVIRRYHEKNAEQVISPEDFFKPYKHFDELLKAKDIVVFTGTRPPGVMQIEQDYEEYLQSRNRGKGEKQIAHDATVLARVRQLRKEAKSSLDAGALLVTCGYLLYKFDWVDSKKNNKQTSVVLPNLLWQALRPFISHDPDFDRSFAETFAIPEFRTVGSGASHACLRMLQILARYEGVNEDIAAKMLANDALIDRLRTTEDRVEFQELVDSAIVAENNNLIEEKTALEEKLEAEKAAQEEEKEERRAAELKASAAESKTSKKEKMIEVLRENQEVNKETIEKQGKTISSEKQAKDTAEERATKAEDSTDNIWLFSSLMISLLITILAMFGLYMWSPNWLVKHINRVPIYGLSALSLFLFIPGFSLLFRERWRKDSLYVLGGSFIMVIIQLLTVFGGNNK